MNEFEDLLLQSCSNNYTGRFCLKLFNSDIVCFDKPERVFPKVIPPGKNIKVGEIIPAGICLKFIGKIREGSFFGDIDIDIKDGKICEVAIKKIYKIKDINKFLSE